jgi:hypothetical protein
MTNIAPVDIIKCTFIYSIELGMYLLSTRIHNTLLAGIGMLCLFLAFSYSDQIMVGFSEFTFLSGTNEVSTLNFEIT